MLRSRPPLAAAVVINFAVLSAATHAQRPSAGRNVNMVSGQEFATGDPFLQRQNEPSIAASTRNPMHLLAGANDYRTVDLPGLPDDIVTGDAWLGVFKSLDGGQKWQSTLIPGFPQDTSPEGLASPLKGLDAGRRSGRASGARRACSTTAASCSTEGTTRPSKVFVSRFVDNNNEEGGDPIRFVDTRVVASRQGIPLLNIEPVEFLDKPWLAVDIKRKGAKRCSIDVPQPDGTVLTQSFRGGNVYVAYSAIRFAGTPLEGSRILFSRSNDCGGHIYTGPVD